MNRQKRSRLPRPPGLAAARRRIPSLAALLFVVGVLLVFNLSNWRYLRMLKEQVREDLEARLRSVAVTTGLGLTHPAPPDILLLAADAGPDNEAGLLEEEFVGTASAQQLAERLLAVQRANTLSRVALMTPSGTMIADSLGRRQPGETYEFLELDQAEMQSAAGGVPTATGLYWLSGTPYLRLYAPLRHEGRLLGLVQVSVSPEYQERIERLQQMVLRQWVVSSLLLIVLGYSLWRLFRYLVQVEERAMRGARVDAMGALAANVAHELRNPLSIIRALSEEITAESAPGSVPRQNARDIVAEVERLNELVTNFLSLSRPPGAGVRQPVDVAAEIGRVLALLRKGQPSAARFVSELPSTPLRVEADPQALRQVLLNLLINAREAVEGQSGQSTASEGGPGAPGGGSIAAGQGEGEVRVTLRERRGWIEIRITDTGPGFDRKAVQRAFEPFFTTKPMGTGLGLAISRGIVENLGGRITVSNGRHGGAEVTVLLPAAGAESEKG